MYSKPKKNRHERAMKSSVPIQKAMLPFARPPSNSLVHIPSLLLLLLLLLGLLL